MATKPPTPSTPAQPLPTDVVDVVESGSLPGVPARNIPATHGQQGKIRASLAQEYVTAGQWMFYLNFLRSLPYDFDDLSKQVGVDVYDKMGNDAQIAKLTNDFIAGMLADEVAFVPCIDDTDDPDQPAAQELAEWCSWVMDHLETPLIDVLWDLAGAVKHGSRLAELVYELKPDKDNKIALLLTKIKVKPRHAVAYVVDSYNNLMGVLGMVPGQPFLPQTGLIITDPAFISNFLPRDKFCLYTFRPVNADPRGTSLLRSAYDPWWVKQQVKRSFVRYLDRFAMPSLIGYTAEGAEVETTIDADGTVSVAGLSPEQWMADRLEQFQNASVATFPFGSKVDKIEAQGNGEAFIAAFKFENDEMAGAILGQTMATEQSKHQTQGAGKVHQDTKDTLMKVARKGMARMVVNDILTPLIVYNRGEAALRLMPNVLIGGVEQHVFQEMAAGVAALQQSGFIGNSQKPGIDQLLGLPQRDVDADAAEAQAAQDAATAAAATNAALSTAAALINKQATGGEVSADAAAASTGTDTPPTANKAAAPAAARTVTAPAKSGVPASTTGKNTPAPAGKTPAAKKPGFAWFTGKRAPAGAAPKQVVVAHRPAPADASRVHDAYTAWAKSDQEALWKSQTGTSAAPPPAS